MESIRLPRCHSRKAKSVSVLPAHPELDPAHRRSGIRHFSHVASLRKATTAPPEQQQQGIRKFSNFGKFKAKNRAVSEFSGPTQFRSLVNQDHAMEEFDEIARATGREQRALKELTSLKANRDRMKIMRRPAPGQGCIILPEEDTISPLSSSMYPYPQHIPPAAAMRPAQRVNSLPGHSPSTPSAPQLVTPPQHPHGLNLTPKDVLNVVCGIAIPIIALFLWIFRTEVIKYGSVIAISVLVCKVGQWNTRVSLENREKELIQQGRLLPEKPAPLLQQALGSAQPGHMSGRY